MMKLSLAVVATILGFSQAFVVAPSKSVSSSTQLEAGLDRRELVTKGAAFALSGLVLTPQVAFAAYQPKFDDMKQILGLGASLDKLIAKIENPDTVESALEGLRAFNRDPDFYTGYAKNYILKVIKKGGDADVRTGYIRQASTLIGSCQAVLEGGTGLVDAEAQADAVKRVKKAQSLIGKFLAECGVKDEKIDAYLASHTD